MLRVGLSGGIGSGKSTVARGLVARGAVLIDSDVIAREVVASGTPGLDQVVKRFGEDILGPDGTLDRPALGRVIFGDDEARAALNAIVHPLVLTETLEQMAAAPADSVVVHDIPLLVELGRSVDYHLVVIVAASEETRLQRLIHDRGMSEDDARARIGAQAGDDRRRAAADVWLLNEGSVEDLSNRVDSLWDNRIQPFNVNLTAKRPVRRPAQITLEAPDPSWPTTAARLLGRIVSQLANAGLGDTVIGADHVGSTSVPGLLAKPVIDLQLRIQQLESASSEVFENALLAAGFVPSRGRRDANGHNIDTIHPWAPEPTAWVKLNFGNADPGRVTHLHVRQGDSAGAQTCLLFRDWLRANPSESAAYAQMKTEMAQSFPGGDEASRGDYPEAKEPWIADALLRARDWAAKTEWTMPRGTLRS
ncbi:dephospho-CoA kinase [Luteipulveratus mongoliensis]|uniref:Dephospho-CoA kinase n=1 Tax=Luteipulveratus mongoliensis TaxID=571913 RepID=A0A0K1JJP3_9MICO|nr:dephospho-CoA kinase [Luteipulveratus mongoliensis]AKU16790.1 hypothetical protein VV02_14460 [Luteipulveratus mongoliensis]